MQDITETKPIMQETTIKNPYPGLRPFLQKDSHLFFGRENQVSDVLSKLVRNNFVGIIGKSGIGKSSFINCGILPKLYSDFPGADTNQWNIISFRPGNNPILQLSTVFAKEVNKLQKESKSKKELSPEEVFEIINSNNTQGFSELVKNFIKSTGKNLLLFVDQFEEVFRFKSDNQNVSDCIALFIDLLIKTAKNADIPLYVVITMRSDYIGECSKYPILTSVINDSQFLIPQMTREEKRNAITGPCKVMGATMEESLVNEILNKVGDDSVQLPVMQHALMRTWDYWEENHMGNEPISLSHYEAIGGMESALSIHANEVFNELNPNLKLACEKCFKSLTEKGDDSRSFRRPATIKELADISQTSTSNIIEIVDEFRKPGRTILTPPTGKRLKEETIIDISHESLMRIWSTLKNWMEEEYESTKQYLRIAEAAELHQTGKGALLKSPELQMSTNWYHQEKPTKAWGIRHHVAFDRTIEYLLFSEKQFLREQRLKTQQQKRRLFIARLIAIIFGSGAVIAGLLVIFALKQKEKANEQAIEANKQKVEANIQKEKANEQTILAEKQSKIAESEAIRALKNEKLANVSRKKAEKERLHAIEQEKLAHIARKRAVVEEQKALKLRMISIAKSMSVKSLQEPDITTKALVSRQAYNFYFDNGGEATDPDIYNALYYSVKALKGKKFNTLSGHTDNVRSIATLANSDKFYSTSSDGRIFSWTSTSDLKFENKLINFNKEQVNKAMALSTDKKWLVVGGDYPYLMLFNLTDNKKKPLKIETGSKQTLFLNFTPDNKGIVYAGSNKKIMLWDFKTNIEIAYPESILNALDIDPTGNFVAAGLEDGQVIVYDLKDNFKSTVFYTENNGNAITSLKYSEHSKMLAIGTIKGRVRILNSSSGTVLASLTGHTARVNQISFNHADNKLATASFDHTVRIWDIDNLYNQPVVLNDHKDWVWSIAFSKDDTYLYAGCRDKLVRAWILDIHKLAKTVCMEKSINRNLNNKEWETYVADDIELECSCSKNCTE